MRVRSAKGQPHKIESNRWSQGVAAVEMALLAPFLILLMMGSWDFGRALQESARLASAARAGVQYGFQGPAYAGDSASIVQAARDDAGDVSGALGITAAQVCQCPSGTPIACNGSCTTGSLQMYVSVQVSESFETWFPYPFVTNPLNLSKQAILRVY